MNTLKKIALDALRSMNLDELAMTLNRLVTNTDPVINRFIPVTDSKSLLPFLRFLNGEGIIVNEDEFAELVELAGGPDEGYVYLDGDTKELLTFRDTDEILGYFDLEKFINELD